jgi:hypothetical protein
MRTALAFWRRSQVSAATSTLVLHRPDQINWGPRGERALPKGP